MKRQKAMRKRNEKLNFCYRFFKKGRLFRHLICINTSNTETSHNLHLQKWMSKKMSLLSIVINTDKKNSVCY